MKMKNLIFVLLFLMLLVSTTGCDRIASIAPLGVGITPTGDAVNFPVGSIPNATEVAVMVQTQSSVLGTKAVAIAKDGGVVGTAAPTTAPAGAGETAVVPTATFTPAPSNTPVPATATAAPTATAAAVTTPNSYALRQGEWVVCIARRYNVDLNALFWMNHINMQSNFLPVGYTLALPTNTSWNPQYGPRSWHAHPAQYTVVPGDTIGRVACFFGDVTPAAIETANGLSGSYALNPGQVLSIP